MASAVLLLMPTAISALAMLTKLSRRKRRRSVGTMQSCWSHSEWSFASSDIAQHLEIRTRRYPGDLADRVGSTMQVSSERPVVEPGGWARDAGTAADAAVFVTTPRPRAGALKRSIPRPAIRDAAFQPA